MKKLRVGITTYEEMKARSMAIARGELKRCPDSPRVWFTSVESFAKVLSRSNQALLRMIREREPRSLDELATLSHRKKSNLSRTLKTMESYGLVELQKGEKRRLVPKVLYEHIVLDLLLANDVDNEMHVRQHADIK